MQQFIVPFAVAFLLIPAAWVQSVPTVPRSDAIDKETVKAPVVQDPSEKVDPDEFTPNPGLQCWWAGMEPFPSRSGAIKNRLLSEGGCNTESERAVAIGLTWLAKQQKQDGGWEFDAGDKTDRTGATGLALLPFLAAGETHQKSKKYNKTVNTGLQFLLRAISGSGMNVGRISENSYSHAIATLALCEAYGLSKDRVLLASTQAAINHIVKSQAEDGSWPAPEGIADSSLVGWQLQALHAARLSKDIVVPNATIKKAIGFLDKTATGKNKAAYGRKDDTDAAPNTSLTATGILNRVNHDGWGRDHAGLAEGVTGFMAKAPGGTDKTPRAGKPTFDMDFFYHATQVIRFHEGDEWIVWFQGPKQADGSRGGGLRDWLISLQLKKDGPNQGSFDPDAGSIGKNYGRLGTTAMCLLSLEVYYRNMPLPKVRKPEALPPGDGK